MLFKKKEVAPSDKRRENRKSFSYYMQLSNANTKEIVGHLSDISTGGFKLDADSPLPLNKEFEKANRIYNLRYSSNRFYSFWNYRGNHDIL